MAIKGENHVARREDSTQATGEGTTEEGQGQRTEETIHETTGRRRRNLHYPIWMMGCGGSSSRD